ncbi:MAG TPA: response regulator transcription factor [Trebonia sp.]|nr:response regulator transcription factor [Trebonia sp.]
MISVLVADDQELVRLGLRALIASEDDLNLAGEAADGLTVVAQARRLRPDVVLMDIRMPGIDGLEATRRIIADPELAGVRIIVLTTFALDEYVFDALRHGASGFLLKDTSPADLVQAIRLIAAGGALLSPDVTRSVIREFVSGSRRPLTPHPQLDTLTAREREIVALAGEGLSNDEIAERLVISPATARTHVSHAMVKLNARDRAQLVVFAFQSGLAG